ncbi:MAG: cysteine--tRNA ligase [Candidatus Thorarchaeota archaeon]|nr:cysteine--tRNA ligase [Candidatus Thorarchaeota archaeon]
MRVYNTLSRTKEDFEPLDGNRVRIYVCGPTVYDYPHIGNARSFVAFDTVRRYLEFRGYRVDYLVNLTDVDDKMIRRANEEGVSLGELAARFIAEYFAVAAQLNLKPATLNPRATEHIEEMIAMIQRIIDAGKAYVVDGNVYFDVSESPTYGTLSKTSLEDLEAGARVEVEEKKSDPKDFALWKAEKPGEPSWDSPWGRGRPGWHIECSVMGAKYLGVPFDIHGGGQDLIFPHHENELAQTSAAYGVGTPVKYWLHNAFLTINSEKMSKSLGNFMTAREVLDNFDHQAVRYFLVSAHYRQPLDYNTGALKQAVQTLERIRNAAETIKSRLTIVERGDVKPSSSDKALAESIRRLREGFVREMDDDFNTPGALAEVFTFIKSVNTHAPKAGRAAILREALAVFTELLGVLGIRLDAQETSVITSKSSEVLKGAVELLLELREVSRKNKDYATADRIRTRLGELGVSVVDTKDGPTWKIE